MAITYENNRLLHDGKHIRLLHESNGDRHWEYCTEQQATTFNDMAAAWWIKHLPSMSSVYNDGTLPPTAESKAVKKTFVVAEPDTVLTDEEQEATSVVHDRT
jgi:hypothetical protein